MQPYALTTFTMKSLCTLILLLAAIISVQAAIIAPTSGPTTGSINITIVAEGMDNFEAQGGMSAVTLASIGTATIVSWTSSTIVFTLPEGAGSNL